MTDRELVVRRLKKLTKAAHHEMSDFCYISVGTASVIVRLLEEQERLDVVRCKDYKHCTEERYFNGHAIISCMKTGDFHEPYWFCADGEREET